MACARVAEQACQLRAMKSWRMLSRQLEQFAGQDEGFNGFLISDLVDLRATEALPVIERAFAAGAVDECQGRLGRYTNRVWFEGRT